MSLSTILLLVIYSLFQVAVSYRMVCVYTNWSQYRPDKGKFLPENVDPSSCTHLIYVYAKLKRNQLEPSEWNDDSTPWMEGMYSRVNSLKQINPDLKTLLGVGGWKMGSKDFSRMASRKKSREMFARTTTAFLRDRDFDGLAVDWQYPTQRGGRRLDRKNFSLLLKELKAAFERESVDTGYPKLLLVAGVGASKHIVDSSYEVDKVSNYTDFLNVMAYDLHGSWDNFTGHPSPLFPRKDETGPQAENNVDTLVKYWVSKGADPSKLVLGISTYGRTFTLKNKKFNGYGVPVIGPGDAGDYTKQEGMLAFYERCSLYFDATRVWDDYSKVPYWYSGQHWIGGEDAESIRAKVNWVRYNSFGGVMINPLDMDDFDGHLCQQGQYPILAATVDQLLVPLVPTTKPLVSFDNVPETTTVGNSSTTYGFDADTSTYYYDYTDFSSTDGYSNESTTTSTVSTTLYSETTTLQQTTTTATTENYNPHIDRNPQNVSAETTESRSSKSRLPSVHIGNGKGQPSAVVNKGTANTTGEKSEHDLSSPLPTRQSLVVNNEQSQFPLATPESTRTETQPIKTKSDRDSLIIEPDVQTEVPQLPEAVNTISRLQILSPGGKKEDSAKGEPSKMTVNAHMLDTIPKKAVASSDNTKLFNSLRLTDVTKMHVERVKPNSGTHKTDIRTQQPILSDGNVRSQSGLQLDSQQDSHVHVTNKQEHILRSAETGSKLGLNKMSPLINHNQRNRIATKDNVRSAILAFTHGQKTSTGQSKTQDVDSIITESKVQGIPEKPKSGNVNDVLDYIHSNGNSDRGRVLSTDTIFKTNSISTKVPKTLQRRMPIVKPRFIFPALIKPEVYNKDPFDKLLRKQQLKVLHTDRNKESEKQQQPLESFSKSKMNMWKDSTGESKEITFKPNRLRSDISKKQIQDKRVTNNPLFHWNINSFRTSNTGGRNNNDVERVMTSIQGRPRNSEKKLSNDQIRTNAVVQQKPPRPFRNIMRESIQHQDKVTPVTNQAKMQSLKSISGVKTSKAMPTDISPLLQPFLSRSIDTDTGVEVNDKPGVKMKNNNHIRNNIDINVKKIDKPRRGMIANVRPVADSKPMGDLPFRVPLSRNTKPILSFVDFKDLGLVRPSSK